MNIELYEGQGARLYITLNGEFSVYGGSDEDTFSVSREGNVYKVDVHPHSRGVYSTHRYDIFAKNSEGKEWLVTSGKINVKNRQSTVGGDALSSVEYYLDLELVEGKESKTKQIIVGIPGKQGEPGKSAYQHAVDNGYVGTEQEFTNMMVGIKLYYEQAEQARQGAVDAQILSEVSAINALKSAQDAQEAVDNIEIPELTPEAIQKVVPMAWGEWMTAPTASGSYSVAIGSAANAAGDHAFLVGGSGYIQSCAVGMGHGANAMKYGVAFGHMAKSIKNCNVTIGSAFSDTAGSYTCTTEGTGSITIGAGANTKNRTDNDGTVIESSNSVTIGCKADNKGADSVVIGASSQGTKKASVVVGAGARGIGDGESVAIGNSSIGSTKAVAVGQNALAYSNCVSIGNMAKTTTTDTIVIGSGATVTDTGATSSTNTTVIGYGATASAPNAVVLGAGASAQGEKSVVIGTTSARGNGQKSIAIGNYAGATANFTTAIGSSTLANRTGATAIGYLAQASDVGVVVFASNSVDFNTRTKLYLSGANTPLANEYYNGEAMMGYTVTDKDGNKLACGTRRLSELFIDNTLTQPASLDENGEWVMPKVFHPSDLDMPTEDPTEPEDVEINIPEPEEYQPLPVYPIVEPEMEEIE